MAFPFLVRLAGSSARHGSPLPEYGPACLPVDILEARGVSTDAPAQKIPDRDEGQVSGAGLWRPGQASGTGPPRPDLACQGADGP